MPTHQSCSPTDSYDPSVNFNHHHHYPPEDNIHLQTSSPTSHPPSSKSITWSTKHSHNRRDISLTRTVLRGMQADDQDRGSNGDGRKKARTRKKPATGREAILLIMGRKRGRDNTKATIYPYTTYSPPRTQLIHTNLSTPTHHYTLLYTTYDNHYNQALRINTSTHHYIPQIVNGYFCVTTPSHFTAISHVTAMSYVTAPSHATATSRITALSVLMEVFISTNTLTHTSQVKPLLRQRPTAPVYHSTVQ